MIQDQKIILKCIFKLAWIYKKYLENGLDECRPEWHHLAGHSVERDLQTEIYTGRGGGCLIRLIDCKEAYEIF